MSFKPFLAYSASAGSGKTFALSVRYISLLFMGEPAGSILAATFTNKAAAEMRQRVVDSLRHLGENKAFLDAIEVETGMSRDVLFRKQPEVLKRFLSSTSHIVTLDSFFSKILRSASLELGLEPDFVTKEQPKEELEKHFLDEVDANGMLSDLVKLAMDIEDKRFKKIFDLMQNFYKVDPLLPAQSEVTLSISKEEEACEILRLEMLKALENAGAPDRCLKQFDTKNTKELFNKKLFEKETLGEHSWYKKIANGEIEAVYAALKQRLLLWAKAKEMVVLHHLFSIYDYYKNATITNARNSGVLTFNDLSYFTYRLLQEMPSSEFLYFKIDAKFRHILLDEFQDTSTLQFLLLKPLIDEIFSGQGQSDFKSFFYVGDTKQSLYRFRGGVEELFDKIAQRYGVQIEQMDTNYRSSRYVVEQVNLWFKDTMEGYVPQKSKTDASEGYVEVFESEEIIDDAVVQAQRLLELGVDVDDIVFLVSTNKDGQNLQEACEKEGIHTLLKTSSSLKNVPKVAALVAMVSYLFGGEKIDAEAMLLKVGKTLDRIDLEWFSVFMSPLQIVDRLIREFGYFDNDRNMLKLLEFASSFSDIPTFLDEFRTSSISVAAHSIHGANIMTIHGSKGLEFEYVIVLDKLTRPNSDKAPLIFHYNDDLHIDQILYRTQNREHFDGNYARIMEERRASSLKDRKNVLYVALTRAVEGLIVIKKPEGSIFDEINIFPIKIGEISVKCPVLGVKEEKSRGSEVVSVTISDYGTQEVGTKEDEEEKDYEAILFGTALHYTLEIMGDFDEQSLKSALVSLRNRYGQLLGHEGLAQIEKRVRSLIENETFQALLNEAKIMKEQSLSFEGELKQIDLLLEYDDHMLVIDYKSSKKYALKHQAQVNYYKRAIEKIAKKPTEGMIIYLLEDKIEIVNLK
ncbi:RecB-like helicase [Sulfurovum sp. NBC37-1]|uniref:RecB-like helicase n=1 Tax=Sulfurovum sp. (strain NBC37-1) TaxID=387093 RepID=UPI00015874AC|nr:RecB-like helicase [Sulfurovum sp. NBC37-1]BAF71147.1 ATP-dependent DNA helicase, UvrD/REP family [Sulfurovum sp. NBC37-1]